MLWKGREKTWLYVHCQEALRENPFFIQSQHICYSELQLPYEQLRLESIEAKITKCCLRHQQYSIQSPVTYKELNICLT